MNGYLQCLIDQYEGKVRKAIGGAERTVYMEVVNDLLKFRKYIEAPEDSTIEDDPKKHIAFDFVGTMPGLIEYLKKAQMKEGE
ncbi:hypothetical protein [Clostridium tyrobutyricum]|uniref:hypothetical protein n=1 Tax=Clostridium tyrobutyricum TaxID=1519 RepID=UPI001C391BF4|nr:hypothetical protein [Clostridium tyrobutyricum]MBV4423445.1 hypothetical protein [Clostridium tyrobutyricum]